VAVEEIVANTSGSLNTVAVPTELPAGMQMEKVFGAPATGTVDNFLEALGVALLLFGLALTFSPKLLRRFLLWWQMRATNGRTRGLA
jgi:Kef-type K+ transport system membrane component KefB